MTILRWRVSKLEKFARIFQVLFFSTLMLNFYPWRNSPALADTYSIGNLSWIRDTIDQAAGSNNNLLLSCVQANVCVAVDKSGTVTTSNNVSSGQFSQYLLTQLTNQPSDLSCDSSGFCMGVTSGTISQLFFGTLQTKQVININSSLNAPLSSVSCFYNTSVGDYCLVGGASGNLYATTNSGQNFSPTQITGFGTIVAISCPAVSYCALVDSAGNFAYSTNPFASNPSWTKELNFDSYSSSINSLSCSSSTFCTVGDALGYVLSTTNASSQTPTWSTQFYDLGRQIEKVSCPSSSLCLFTDSAGLVGASQTPANGGYASYQASNSALNLSCPSTSFCIISDTKGDIFYSAAPASLSFKNPLNAPADPMISIYNVSCVTLPPVILGGNYSYFCAAVDGNGNILTSNNPLGGPSAWNSTTLPAGNNLPLFITCTTYVSSGIFNFTLPWCMVAEFGGMVTYSDSISSAQPSWSTPQTIDNSFQLESGQCQTTSLCVFGDSAGNVVYSTNPSSGPWSLTNVSTYPINSISCPSSSSCFAGDTRGIIFSFSSGTWTSSAETYRPLASLSCVSNSFCVASGRDGSISLINGQTVTSYGLDNNFTIVNCPSTSLCVAASGPGTIYVSNNPGSNSSWFQANANGNANLLSISCPSTDLCVSSDTDSSIQIGTTLPVITSVSPNKGPTTGNQSVLLRGINLNGTSAVSFGSNKASSYTSSLNQIIVTSPSASSAGSVDITVTSANGSSFPRTSDQYDYVSGNPYFPMSPVRICDTRSTSFSNPCNQPGKGTLGPGKSLTLQVSGTNGVPNNATAVVINVTVTNTTANGGFLTIWPTGTNMPNASNINWSAGETIANLTTPTLSSSGSLSFYNSVGNADVIVDLEGYFAPYSTSSDGGSYVAIPPNRIVDTRANSGYYLSGQTLTYGQTVTIPPNLLPSDAGAVILNVTVTNTNANGGFLTVFPQGTNTPNASNLNWSMGATIANRVIVQVNNGVSITNAIGNADVIVDISGYITNSSSIATGSFYQGSNPTRICDTRSTSNTNQCNQSPNGTLNTNAETINVSDSLLNLPSPPVALVTNVTATNTKVWSFLTVGPYGSPEPPSSDLNWSGPGVSIANDVIISMGSQNLFTVYNAFGSVDVIVDVEGYFQ